VIDANPKAARRLQRIAVARRKILHERSLKTNAPRLFQSSSSSKSGTSFCRGHRRNSGCVRRTRWCSTGSAQRALVDIAARKQERVGDADARGNPYTAAMYMKLCERFDDMRVCPTMPRGAEAQKDSWATATTASLRKLVTAFNVRLTGDDPEATDASATREATKLHLRPQARRAAAAVRVVGTSSRCPRQPSTPSTDPASLLTSGVSRLPSPQLYHSPLCDERVVPAHIR